MSVSRAFVVVVLGSLLGIGSFLLFGNVGKPISAASPKPPSPSMSSQPAPPVSAAPPTTRPKVPSTPPGPVEPGRGWLVIHGMGDVALDPAYIPNLARRGYEHAFSGFNGMFRGDDLTVANLECTPSRLGRPLEKAFDFRCDPDALIAAAAAGIDVFNLANNHGQDFGTEAMLDGRANVHAAGIGPVGVGADLEEALTPAFVESDGWRIAVLGFGAVVPSSGWLARDDRPGMASGRDLPLMTRAVAAAADEADLVVVTIHWGRELETVPSAEMQAVAEALIAAGADMIFGHHQHRLNPLTFVDGRPVAWGLGSPEGESTACLIPAFIEESGHPVPTGPGPCSPAEGPRDPSILDASI